MENFYKQIETFPLHCYKDTYHFLEILESKVGGYTYIALHRVSKYTDPQGVEQTAHKYYLIGISTATELVKKLPNVLERAKQFDDGVLNIGNCV